MNGFWAILFQGARLPIKLGGDHQPSWISAFDSAEVLRRTPRHTTHHQDLPKHVTITRPQHPLEGKKLAVFGQRRYQDKLHLILSMPQGGRALIPKEWTDLEALPRDSPAQATPPTTFSVRFGSCFMHALS